MKAILADQGTKLNKSWQHTLQQMDRTVLRSTSCTCQQKHNTHQTPHADEKSSTDATGETQTRPHERRGRTATEHPRDSAKYQRCSWQLIRSSSPNNGRTKRKRRQEADIHRRPPKSRISNCTDEPDPSNEISQDLQIFTDGSRRAG